MYKFKKQFPVIIFMILLMIFSLSAAIAAGFGESQDFNEQGNSFSNEGVHNNRPYFIHDTLIKLIFLLVFATLALYIFFKRHDWRKYILILSVIILGFYLQGFLCPLTAIRNVFTKYDTAYLLLFLVPVILALFFGRIYCGYICPFGAIQELLFITKLQLKIPEGIKKFLNKIKYLLFIYLLIRVLITNEVILSGYTPFKSFFILGGTAGTIIITVITAILSIVIFRPFCRFFCPLGVFLGLVSFFKKNRIIAASQCVKCGKCTETCPVGAVKNNKIDPKECINCCKCLDCCPFNEGVFRR